jgi:hypothetical protein
LLRNVGRSRTAAAVSERAGGHLTTGGEQNDDWKRPCETRELAQHQTVPVLS